MATQLTIGPSNGGAGTSQVDITVTLTFNNSAEAVSFALKNTFSPLYIQPRNLSQGANVISVPQSPQTPGGVFIIPQPEATYKGVLRGHASDLGVPLNMNAPTHVSFGAPGLKAYAAQAVTLTNATEIVNLTAHGLVNGQRISLGGTLPAELSQQVVYYVIVASANTFQLSLTPYGSAVLFSTDGANVTVTTLDPPATLNLHWAGKGYLGTAVTADSVTDKIALATHELQNGDRVKFGGVVVPGGLVADQWYYIINRAAGDFEVSATLGGSKIDITTTGTSVTITTADQFKFIWV